jgi:hypothetical protein
MLFVTTDGYEIPFVRRHSCRGGQFQRDLVANRTRHLHRGRQPGLVFGNIEIRFVGRQRFDQVRVALEDFPCLTGGGSIAWEVWRQEHGFRAKAFGSNSGNGATLSELSVQCGR